MCATTSCTATKQSSIRLAEPHQMFAVRKISGAVRHHPCVTVAMGVDVSMTMAMTTTATANNH
jgi:hypothetical protein